MRKSGSIRLRDVRRAYRLILECRDVRHDPSAWPVVLADGLLRLVDADVTVIGEIALARAGSTPTSTLLVDRGWSSPGCRAFWQHEYMESGVWARGPTFSRFSSLEGGLITRSREQLVDDSEWDNSEEYREYFRTMGLDDILASNARSGDPPTLQGFQVLRGLGRPRFGAAERRLLRLFHRELALYHGPLMAREAGGPAANLPPRLRQTFDCLMQGDSEKQVAARLGLSRHTVHEYVTLLYRRLGVGSRAELMALGIRHRPVDDFAPPR